MPIVNAVKNKTTEAGGATKIINLHFPVPPYLPLPTVPVEGGLTKRPGGTWGARFSLHKKW